MKIKKRIGFFGGCFNPVTNAHIELIKNVIKKENLDKVYFVPMGDNYQKNDLVEFKHRKNMLELVFENNPKIDVLDILSNQNKKTYAIDTFKIIEELFKDEDRFFIMGSDNYENISSWKDSKDLTENYKYIILDRNIISKTKNISSSIVREKIKLKENIDELVPYVVREYIVINKLYK